MEHHFEFIRGGLKDNWGKFVMLKGMLIFFLLIWGMYVYVGLWVEKLWMDSWCFYFQLRVGKKNEKKRKKSLKKRKKEKKLKTKFIANKRHSQLISYIICGVMSFGVRVLVIFSFWSNVSCSIVLLVFSFTSLEHLSLFSFTFKLTLPPMKDLSVLICTLHVSGKEFENLGKPTVDCIIGLSLEWACIIFQAHEWEWFTFF